MFKTVLVLIYTLSKCQTYNCSSKNENWWKNMIKLKPNWQVELNQDLGFESIIARCIKQVAYGTLYRVLESDHVEIFDGFDVIKYKHENNTLSFWKNQPYHDATSLTEDQILNMLLNISQRYSLKISLNKFVNKDKTVNEGRHRRRRHHMMPFMLFGVVGLSMILIPMGFKFLTILGGKALLLAKMALMLSSIQGLKKLATSNYNYGLYQTPSVHPLYYERHGYEEIPDTKAEVLPHPHAYIKNFN